MNSEYDLKHTLRSLGFDPEQHTALIAVSGGLDSVCLAHLFYQNQWKAHLAHVNFRLRGDESDGDEVFVKDLGLQWGLPVHTVQFNTSEVAEAEGISIQMAARKLRYQWFAELTAHYHLMPY